MKILFIEWESYGYQDIKEAFLAEGHQLVAFPFQVFGHQGEELLHDQETETRMQHVLKKEVPDVVFSVDYFPVISKVCQKENIRYISYSYDCPHTLLYSATIRNPCNTAYVFDKATCQEFRDMGIATVQYLPLAANTERLDALTADQTGSQGFCYDVSFLGSLYLEKNNYYDRMTAALPDHAKGYLSGLIAAQLKISGYDFIEESLGPVIRELYEALPMAIQPDGMETLEFLYAQYIINRRITTIERIDILDTIAKVHPIDLFTYCRELDIPNLQNHGPVDHDSEMPHVFKQSRINLNITLRGIQSGVPLRAFDIMGSGGFLLSDFQADYLELFVPGEDFVYYKDQKDLLQKVDYYLKNEDERRQIAKNGHDKIAAGHTYRHRVREMLSL